MFHSKKFLTLNLLRYTAIVVKVVKKDSGESDKMFLVSFFGCYYGTFILI